MSDFKFIEDKLSGRWVISAPRRARRPDSAKGTASSCPFCPGKEGEEQELYRIGGEVGDSNWEVRVVPNKYPFAPIHEIVIHSQDHHKNFGELPDSQVELIFKAYRQRFQTHKDAGQVYIFHNRGEVAGESLPHPHSQITVIPQNVKLNIPVIPENEGEVINTKFFSIFCPLSSEWPDEVWLAPSEKSANQKFTDITDQEISDFAGSFNKLVQIMDLRHGNEFPFNFYIYPGQNWYLRLIPRLKTLGGFELGTGVFVNTQDPRETIGFLKEHFENPDAERIKTIRKADYKRGV